MAGSRLVLAHGQEGAARRKELSHVLLGHCSGTRLRGPKVPSSIHPKKKKAQYHNPKTPQSLEVYLFSSTHFSYFQMLFFSYSTLIVLSKRLWLSKSKKKKC